jgi:hypothetical protein
MLEPHFFYFKSGNRVVEGDFLGPGNWDNPWKSK